MTTIIREFLSFLYLILVDAMLKLLFVGVLLQVVTPQTLYQSVLISDSFLQDGKEKELNMLLHGCENKLREESIKSSERIRKKEELVSKLEASDIALMTLQGHYFQGKA